MPRTDRTPSARARAKDWADAFFDAFEKTHLVREAAKVAGVARSTVYKRRDEDEAFRERWAEVEEHSTQILEQIAVKRAAQESDRLLEFLLKARRPNVYRENHRVEHVGRDGEAIQVEVSAKVADAAHGFLEQVRRAQEDGG